MNKILGVVALLSSTCVLADDDNGKPLDLSLELGILSISGNTSSSSVKSKVDIKHNLENWRNNYVLDGLYKEEELVIDTNGSITKVDQLTAKKYFASAQADYKLNENHKGLFIFGSYLYDKFSGYEYQATLAAGYSDQLFKTDTSFLNYSVGPGMAYSKAEDTIDENDNVVAGESDSSPILRLAANYQYTFRKGVKFTQTLSSDAAFDSDENSKTKSESALSAQVGDSLALKLSYTVTHNSLVPEGNDKVDAQTALTVVYTL